MYVPDSYRTSVLFATLSTYFSLVSSFCSSDQMFAADFFQIPPRDGHPCLSGYTIPTIRARWGLAPVRHYSCRAYQINPEVLFYATSRRDFMLFEVLPDSNILYLAYVTTTSTESYLIKKNVKSLGISLIFYLLCKEFG